MKPLIIVRPEPGNRQSVERAMSAGLDVISEPLFKIQRLKFNSIISDTYDAIFITSANAVLVAGTTLANLTALPLLAVGPVSAAAAQQAGFSTILTGKSDGDGLADLAAAHGFRRLLHLVGDPYKAISHPDLKFDVVPVYRVVDVPVGPALSQALAKPAVILAHSPRAARRLHDVVGNKGQTDLVTISAQTAKASGTGWKSISWPSHPDAAAMIDLAGPLCRAP